MAQPFRIGPVSIAQGVSMTAAGLILAGAGAAVTTEAWTSANIIANASMVLGVLLILWGITVHGLHLWQPWWMGPPVPVSVSAWTAGMDYAEGSTVAGIPWQQGFAHIRVSIKNTSPVAVQDFSALLAPDVPIIRSSVTSDFAECRIGSAAQGQMPHMTMSITKEDGSVINLPGGGDRLIVGPPHRLFCERFPSGADVDVDLASAMPNEPGALKFLSETRTDPSVIVVEMSWNENGEPRGVGVRLGLTRTVQ